MSPAKKSSLQAQAAAHVRGLACLGTGLVHSAGRKLSLDALREVLYPLVARHTARMFAMGRRGTALMQHHQDAAFWHAV